MQISAVCVDNLGKLACQHPLGIDALVVEVGAVHDLDLMPVVLPLVPPPLHLVADTGKIVVEDTSVPTKHASGRMIHPALGIS